MEGIIIITPNKSSRRGVIVEDDLKKLGDYLELFLDENDYYYNLNEHKFDVFDTIDDDYPLDFVGVHKLKETEKKIYSLGVPSQDTLSFLKIFLPNEKFVSYKRWGRSQECFFDEAYMTGNSKKFNKDKRIDVPGEDLMIDDWWETDFDIWDPDELVIFKLKDYEKRVDEYKGGMMNLE